MFKLLFLHELKINFRTKEAFFSMISFGLVLSATLAFSIDLSANNYSNLLPGLFWMMILFMSVLGINRMFSHDVDFNAISMVSSAPVNRGMIFLSKTVAGVSLLMIVEFVILPWMGFIFSQSFFTQPLVMCGLISLGNISIITTGVFISGLTLSSRMNNVLVPLLMFPLLAPVLISLTKATQASIQGLPIGEGQIWILILSTYGILFLLLGYGLFDYLLEE
jgi:heme exporter protein B